MKKINSMTAMRINNIRSSAHGVKASEINGLPVSIMFGFRMI